VDRRAQPGCRGTPGVPRSGTPGAVVARAIVPRSILARACPGRRTPALRHERSALTRWERELPGRPARVPVEDMRETAMRSAPPNVLHDPARPSPGARPHDVDVAV
jgi:hypothetical protein